MKKNILLFGTLLTISTLSLSTLTTVYADSNQKSHSFVAKKSKKKKSKKKSKKYIDDSVENDFITKYNKISNSDFTDISKGNIRTKYFAKSNGDYFELLDAADTEKISITINQTFEKKEDGMVALKPSFHDSVKAIDNTLKDEDIDSFFDSLISGRMLTDQKLGKLTIDFIPMTDSSTGRIDIKEK